MASVLGPQGSSKRSWEMTLGQLLEKAISDVGEHKLFAEICGHSITYGSFWSKVSRTASMFHSLGVKKRDRVCLFLPNCPEVLYCWFGLSVLGAITVPINIAYKKDETAFILNDSDAVVLVAHHSMLTVANQARQMAKSVQHGLVVGEMVPFEDNWISMDQAMLDANDISLNRNISSEDISMLVYTSGTTGNPKGVQINHKMYVAAGQGFAYWTEANSDDRFFTCLPYYHANAQYYSTMGSLASGASLIVTERFSASRFWGEVRDTKASVVNFIGMMMQVLAKQAPIAEDLKNDVRLFYGSPSFSPEFLGDFEKRFGTKVIVGFGLTETCYGTIENIHQPRRPNSSGSARQHPDPRFKNSIFIRDDKGAIVDAGEIGEITIKNPTVTPGYWKNKEQTTSSLRNGWLYTGDLGWMDNDGFVYFVDRKKDVIRRRGENISSQQVEAVLKRHPEIIDCAVIAVPSDLGEDEVKAYVIARPDSTITPTEIVFWCADKLAYFKVPRYIELRSNLPRTPSLRIRKDLLRRERSDLTADSFDREAEGIDIR